ncbi:MAG: rhodanese-like domain-containing protein [Bacteroidia bacterium]
MNTDISVIEFKKRIDAGETLRLLDVREPYEFEESNLNGLLIPLGDLPSRWEEIQDWKDHEVVVHCKSGARSGTAKLFLQQLGFTQVRNLLGGILDYQREFPSEEA